MGCTCISDDSHKSSRATKSDMENMESPKKPDKKVVKSNSIRKKF